MLPVDVAKRTLLATDSFMTPLYHAMTYVPFTLVIVGPWLYPPHVVLSALYMYIEGMVC